MLFRFPIELGMISNLRFGYEQIIEIIINVNPNTTELPIPLKKGISNYSYKDI